MVRGLKRYLLAQGAVAPLVMLLAGTAMAQTAAGGSAASAAENVTQIQEVVVTATKTGAQQLQKVPEAVSVTTALQLLNSGVNGVADLAKFIPSMTFAVNTSHAEIYIRGIGSSNVGVGSDPDVTTQIDGVYIARSSGQMMDFVDIDRIEVLRGPQGTLYGRNAVGGAINIVSRTPSKYFTGQLVLSGGNYGSFQGAGYVSGPLAGSVQGSLAFNYERHDPYFTNIAPGGNNVGGGNNGGLKAQVRWEPTADIDATTRADVSYNNSKMEAYSQLLAPTRYPSLVNSIIGDYSKVALNSPQLLNSLDGGVSEEINWRFAPQFNLKSITALRTDHFGFDADTDSTDLNLSYLISAETDIAVTQEFNLQYNSDKFKGVGGVFFFHDRDEGLNNVEVPPSVQVPSIASFQTGGRTKVDSTSLAVFGQGTYYFTPAWSLVAGARYTYETKTMDQDYTHTHLFPALLGVSYPGYPSIFNLSHDYYAFTPKVGLNWQVTSDALLYVSATKGYKSGGFNFGSATPQGAEFAPESIWNYELGAKTQWFDRRLQVNIAAFYYDYKNLQVQQLLAFGITSIGNAATATGRGVEADVLGKVTRDLQVSANVSLLDAKYDSYKNASVPQGAVSYVTNEVCTGVGNPTCTTNATGRYLSNAPTASAVGAIDYSHDLDEKYVFAAHVDYTWRDRTYFDPSNVAILSQAPYGLLNAQVSIATSNQAWRFQLFGKNLTNQVYSVTRSAAGFLPAAQIGDPRVYGVRLTRNW